MNANANYTEEREELTGAGAGSRSCGLTERSTRVLPTRSRPWPRCPGTAEEFFLALS